MNVHSSEPTAIDNAAPVERKTRLPCGTGHRSRRNLLSESVNAIAQLRTGCKIYIIQPAFEQHSEENILQSRLYHKYTALTENNPRE